MVFYCIGACAFSSEMFNRGAVMVHGGEYHCNGTESRLVFCAKEARQCGQEDYAGVRCMGGVLYIVCVHIMCKYIDIQELMSNNQCECEYNDQQSVA